LSLYHGLSRNKHNNIPLKLALEILNNNFLTKQTNKQNGFQEVFHPEDHELVNVIANIFVSYTLRLYHGLSRNKHNKIPLKLALESPNYNFYTKKTNKQKRFQELLHPEDHELVNVIANIFVSYTLRLYHGLSRNKHNNILLKLALESPTYNF
jgi:hypothetical protein